jgi:hypothetical protein
VRIPTFSFLTLLLVVLDVRAVEWEPILYPDSKIFPSYVVSTATVEVPEDVLAKWDVKHVGDENGMIGVILKEVPKGAKFRVEILENELMGSAVITGTIPSRSEEWLILPKIPYKFPNLLRQAQPAIVNITFKVSVDGVSQGEQIARADVRSINECLTAVLQDEESEPVDFSWLFAAYVNENHPQIDGILREALDAGVVTSFTGYQSGERQEVRAQIKAIWDVLQKRGFRYSDITTTDSESEVVNSQYVRFFDDAIKSRSANCVDGTVLMASILRRIGLQVTLAMLPTHMFLVVDLDEEGKKQIAIETTMMGDNAAPRKSATKGKPSTKAEPVEAASTFGEAVRVGNEQFRENEDNFADEDALDYQLIDVSEARRLGIRPIALP